MPCPVADLQALLTRAAQKSGRVTGLLHTRRRGVAFRKQRPLTPPLAARTQATEPGVLAGLTDTRVQWPAHREGSASCAPAQLDWLVARLVSCRAYAGNRCQKLRCGSPGARRPGGSHRIVSVVYSSRFVRVMNPHCSARKILLTGE